jgi:hypothetical protein
MWVDDYRKKQKKAEQNNPAFEERNGRRIIF